MLRTTMLIALLTLFSGCASIDALLFDANPDGTPIADPALQRENQQLKAEAAALREEVQKKREMLEAGK